MFTTLAQGVCRGIYRKFSIWFSLGAGNAKVEYTVKKSYRLLYL